MKFLLKFLAIGLVAAFCNAAESDVLGLYGGKKSPSPGTMDDDI